MKFLRSRIWNSNKPFTWAQCLGLLPSAMVVGIVIWARLAGLFQELEWTAFDTGLRLRPHEPRDERIVIVGITEADIQTLKTYPISDQALATLLDKIQRHQPRAIGLDIFRDFPEEPGHTQLKTVLASLPNVIGIESILPTDTTMHIKPPPSLPIDQVGFVDSILDSDGAVRRSLLGFRQQRGKDYQFSFTIRLAQLYLAKQGITLENSINDPKAMRLGRSELTRFRENTGSYVRADARGNQILINFRNGSTPFQMVSMADTMADQIDPELFRDRIVLIGITAKSHQDFHNVPAVATPTQPLTYGVVVQAHAISQIISSALDRRPLLNTWPDFWDYLWMITWGAVGLVIGQLSHSIKYNYGLVIMAIICLTGLAYGGLIIGMWVPFVPTIFVFLGTNIIVYTLSIHNKNLETLLQDQQQIIERTFNAIHNGPLQTLAAILRYAEESESDTIKSYDQLQQLNRELRDIYEQIRRETLEQGREFIVIGDRTYDLSLPLHRVLYEVYTYTIQRDFPGLKKISLNVVDFNPLDTNGLSIDNKRSICRFLEEAICNIGKHASGPTRLTIVCKQVENHNVLRIEDNGRIKASDSIIHPTDHRGTKQAIDLSKELGGNFKRRPGTKSGTVCELIWPIKNIFLSKLSILSNNE